MSFRRTTSLLMEGNRRSQRQRKRPVRYGIEPEPSKRRRRAGRAPPRPPISARRRGAPPISLNAPPAAAVPLSSRRRAPPPPVFPSPLPPELEIVDEIEGPELPTFSSDEPVEPPQEEEEPVGVEQFFSSANGRVLSHYPGRIEELEPLRETCFRSVRVLLGRIIDAFNTETPADARLTRIGPTAARLLPFGFDPILPLRCIREAVQIGPPWVCYTPQRPLHIRGDSMNRSFQYDMLGGTSSLRWSLTTPNHEVCTSQLQLDDYSVILSPLAPSFISLIWIVLHPLYHFWRRAMTPDDNFTDRQVTFALRVHARSFPAENRPPVLTTYQVAAVTLRHPETDDSELLRIYVLLVSLYYLYFINIAQQYRNYDDNPSLFHTITGFEIQVISSVLPQEVMFDNLDAIRRDLRGRGGVNEQRVVILNANNVTGNTALNENMARDTLVALSSIVFDPAFFHLIANGRYRDVNRHVGIDLAEHGYLSLFDSRSASYTAAARAVIDSLRLPASSDEVTRIMMRGGGCLITSKKKGTQIPHSLRRAISIFKISVSKNNNCFFCCIYDAFRDTLFRHLFSGDPDVTHELLRSQCGIPSGILIGSQQIEIACARFGMQVRVYTIGPTQDIGAKALVLSHAYGDPNSPHSVSIMLHEEHYTRLASDHALSYRYCACCYKWMPKGRAQTRHMLSCHRCPDCHQPITAETHKSCRGHPAGNSEGRGVVRSMSKSEDAVKWKQDVYFADFETSPFGLSTKHIVYAAGIVDIHHMNDPTAVKITYGKNAAEQFVRYVCNNIDSGTIVFYNGSGFDFIFIIETIMRLRLKAPKICDVVLKDNRILTFSLDYGLSKVRFFDLYLFLRMSLAAACRDLGVPKEYCKGSFDHTKMRDFQAMAQYRIEVTDYLRLDCLALAHCYYRFAEFIFKNFEINVLGFVSLSHLAFEIWALLQPADVNIPVPNYCEDQYLRRALFGGRCGPQFTHFVSGDFITMNGFADSDNSFYESLVADAERQVFVTDEEFAKIDDYLTIGDVVSLYPSQMSFSEYPHDRFMIHRVSDNEPAQQEKLLERLVKGEAQNVFFYEVDVTPPDDIITPYLQERGKHGEVIYSLWPKKKALYYAEELREALSLGYRVDHIYSYVTFPKSTKLFESFVERCFELKKNSVKGTVQYLVAKLLMNSLSGKMSQRTIVDEWTYLTDLSRLEDVVRKREFTELRYIYDGLAENPITHELDRREINVASDEPIGYAVKTERFAPKPTKPVYLGAAILANSRVWMSRMMRAIDGYKDCNNAFYYTDTDSLVLHHRAFEMLRKHALSFVGKELGNLDDELGGGKIVKAIFLAPKTYILEFITATPGNHRLKWKIRTKGIPHTSDEIDVFDYYRGLVDSKLEYALYGVNEEEGVNEAMEVQRCITMKFFGEMLFRSRHVVVQMDSLKRVMAGHSMQGEVGIMQAEDMSRTVNRSYWWGGGKRLLVENPSKPGFSLPCGFNMDKANQYRSALVQVKTDEAKEIAQTLVEMAAEEPIRVEQAPCEFDFTFDDFI